MKTKKIFTLFILSFFLASCIGRDPSKGPTYFYVKNVSNHNVQLTVFNATIPDSFLPNKDTTYLIPHLSEFKYISGAGYGEYLHPLGGVTSDSAFVTFDDTLRVSYRRNDMNPRNILIISSYSGGNYEYHYSITPEDYTKAKRIKK